MAMTDVSKTAGANVAYTNKAERFSKGDSKDFDGKTRNDARFARNSESDSWTGTWPMAERGHEDVKHPTAAEHRSLNGTLRFRRVNVLGRWDLFRLHRRGASACCEWC
jgi:hypothetical protein